MIETLWQEKGGSKSLEWSLPLHGHKKPLNPINASSGDQHISPSFPTGRVDPDDEKLRLSWSCVTTRGLVESYSEANRTDIYHTTSRLIKTIHSRHSKFAYHHLHDTQYAFFLTSSSATPGSRTASFLVSIVPVSVLLFTASAPRSAPTPRCLLAFVSIPSLRVWLFQFDSVRDCHHCYIITKGYRPFSSHWSLYTSSPLHSSPCPIIKSR